MNKKGLVIGAHPDDETFGMGGTIAKYTSQDYIVHVLIITDGSSSQYEDHEKMIKKKKKEAKKSMNILGVKKIQFGKLPDMKLDTIPHVKINEVIEEKIENFGVKSVIDINNLNFDVDSFVFTVSHDEFNDISADGLSSFSPVNSCNSSLHVVASP